VPDYNTEVEAGGDEEEEEEGSWLCMRGI